ncbi:AAA family ATPase (plasmid) [Bradyrhizobium barranii subsp. apii]|uniref:AAA family ATPase n=1 Tax=Bradyrhizobium TaxID=374 RepID=UPI001CD1B85E|nr:AAA family ATPase [Bradyrhizobium barranii]UPU01649.1 AAA family ATPase [Bradyrhizobium barranii subsp. apii]
MKHSAIILTICRQGLKNDDPGFRRQVERLRDALLADADSKDAAMLQRLLETAADETLEPARARLASGLITGEALVRDVQVPVDKDTGAALADVVHDFGSYSELELPAETKAALDSITNGWLRFEDLKKLGVAPSRSCLLFGLPGTGKTAASFSIARKLGLPLVVARLDGIVSSFLGTTARNIGNLFEFANRYRCVLLLDEFDGIAKLRDDPQEVGEIKRVVNALLQNLDKRENVGITLAATNHPNLLDPAVWRRFEVRMEMPLPGPAQRRSIVRRFIQPLDVDEAEIDFLTWVTHDQSGADLKTMTNSIKRSIALRERDDVTALMHGLKHYATTSASVRGPDRLRLLLEDERSLAQALVSDGESPFTRAAVGSLLNKDPSTISRWTAKESVAELAG